MIIHADQLGHIEKMVPSAVPTYIAVPEPLATVWCLAAIMSPIIRYCTPLESGY
jgi:hypothetical protein